MAGRGPQSFKKRQKEQQRKEKQQEKLAKRMERKRNPLSAAEEIVPGPQAPLDDEIEGPLGEPEAPLGEPERP